MKIGPYKKSTYNRVLRKIGIKKLTLNEKINILQTILSEDKYETMIKELKTILEDESIKDNKKKRYLSQLVIQKYSRFSSGIPFLIKTRKLDLHKYYPHFPEKSEIDHAGIFFVQKNTIYHLLPPGIKSGEEEFNKEEASYDWVTHDHNKNGAFFTLRSFDEINIFIKKWEDKIGYDYHSRTSELFAYTLAYWLL
uniref:Uncharacterized protein n=1 Tax=Mimivirus LCMiAC01 TaxID=2506608 RepID=A0A481Z045_9VIRU|nr:MAG: hypothetical protein LCMiAC01_05200 [Mimivirus LCMiAC01]